VHKKYVVDLVPTYCTALYIQYYMSDWPQRLMYLQVCTTGSGHQRRKGKWKREPVLVAHNGTLHMGPWLGRT